MQAARFGLIVVGDEILSGRKQDVHLSFVVELLARHNQELAWARYLSDDPEPLEQALKDSFASGDIVFVTGGIGATPDDRTRQSAARALGLEVVAHPEGVAILREIFSGQLNDNRTQLACFPEGADLIPNPVNRVSGFSLSRHYFVPGFPKMAHPMLEWVMENYYQDLAPGRLQELGCRGRGLSEGRMIPLLEDIEARFDGVKTFSLPSNREDGVVDLGVKGREPEQLKSAFAYLLEGIPKLVDGVEIELLSGQS